MGLSENFILWYQNHKDYHIPSKMTIYHVTLFMLVASLGNDYVEQWFFLTRKKKKKKNVLGHVWFMLLKTIFCYKKQGK